MNMDLTLVGRFFKRKIIPITQIARSRKGKTDSENTYPYFEVDRLPETRQSFYRVCFI